jgi:hypothetical protein
MMYPIKGANDLLRSLVEQKEAIKAMDGNRREEIGKWQQRAESVQGYFEELKTDFAEQGE